MAIPNYVKKYFWGDDSNELNWYKHRKYITQTILDRGDRDAVAWLLKYYSKQQLQKQLPQLKLSGKSRNFWQMYLS